MFRRRCVPRLLSCASALLAFVPAGFAQSSSSTTIPSSVTDSGMADSDPNSDSAPGELFFASASNFADFSIDAVADTDTNPKSSSDPDVNSNVDAARNSSDPRPLSPVRPFPGVPETLPAPPDQYRISQDCAAGVLSGRDCKYHWLPALSEQVEDLAVETSWNLAQNRWVRYNTFHGNFWHNYWLSVQGFRFNRWCDNNPLYDDYLGHPMMGAISMDIFIQNDPRGMSLELENSPAYWHSRLRALLWATVYSAEWKVGPVSEASFGSTGTGLWFDKSSNRWTNGTGSVGLVVTPVLGWAWSMGEDVIDQHVIRRIETKSGNPVYLFAIQFLNPCRGFSNLMRFKAPWYRDSRDVDRPQISANNSGD
jgi:hypothetical protein